MRQILSRSLLTVAAASSILAVTGGYANADSDAQGGASGSPGLLSGDSVQAPVDVPVNACGNTVNAVAAGNAAMGNGCGNESHGHSAHSAGGQADTPARNHAHHHVHHHPHAGSGGHGGTTGSPGVLSGNSADIPVGVPVNACGNTVDPLALLNPAMGNSCGGGGDSAGGGSGSGSGVEAPPVGTPQPAPHLAPQPVPQAQPGPPSQSHHLPPRQHVRTPDQPFTDPVSAPHPRLLHPQLAETGIDGREIGAAGATSAALLLGGAMLYRRGTRTPQVARV